MFCDQRQITARSKAPTPSQVQETIDTWLSTLQETETVEIAFYGGSFTAIPKQSQIMYLGIAKEYVDKGLVSNIHISTRPDAIDEDILDMLASYKVATIELGVQSFDDNVLALSKRGHNSAQVIDACKAIKRRGLNLGIQLMVGLPGDSLESCIYSAKSTVELKPDLARIYPTLVLGNTELMDMYKQGLYEPLSREEALLRTKAIYRILDSAGIYIMRVGLKSTDIINSHNLGSINSGAYHPAFRQLVEGEIAKERIEELIKDSHSDNITILVPAGELSNVIGHERVNAEYFNKEYPGLTIRFKESPEMPSGEYTIEQ